jgi:hypothetical protein
MAELEIPQIEADSLMAMEKHRANNATYNFPDSDESLTIPLISFDKREDFLLDLSRGKIDLTKVKYQNRARVAIILLRLDLAGAPHRNPDGAEISCPHLHKYREGFGDKWAEPLPANVFSNLNDVQQVLLDFMSYCNVTQPPIIQTRLIP